MAQAELVEPRLVGRRAQGLVRLDGERPVVGAEIEVDWDRKARPLEDDALVTERGAEWFAPPGERILVVR